MNPGSIIERAFSGTGWRVLSCDKSTDGRIIARIELDLGVLECARISVAAAAAKVIPKTVRDAYAEVAKAKLSGPHRWRKAGR